eukprot:TRINITY_DN12925_c0_g1_i2.p1 TRINITY_DN12925_c0_g1~~TRINITY_DN12925_c0_g1_i2.p1  ORF type:complete len:540 (-),score=98.06 TRINITY_DN12925_c0_g1_i2:114-1733(-)
MASESVPCLMIIDCVTSESESKEDEQGLFCFPVSSPFSNLVGLLIALQGSTLSVTGQHVQTILFDSPHPERPLVACYVTEGSLILVLFLSAPGSEDMTPYILDDLHKMILLLYGSLEKLVSTPSATSFDGRKTTIYGRVLPIFEYFFADYSHQELSFLYSFTQGVRYLPLPTSWQLQLSEEMNNLETTPIPENRRLTEEGRVSLITGSCIFHHGILLYSSLHPKHISEIFRLCRLHGIFRRTSASPELIVCKEVHSLSEKASFIQPEERERRIVVIVAQAESAICILLACNIDQQTKEMDPLYVESCRSSMHRLRTTGIFSTVQSFLSRTLPPTNPSLLNPSDGSETQYKISSGLSNCLITYVDYSSIQGVILTPFRSVHQSNSCRSESKSQSIYSILFSGYYTAEELVVLSVFLQTAAMIRKTFRTWKGSKDAAYASPPPTEDDEEEGLDLSQLLIAQKTPKSKKMDAGDPTPFLLHRELVGYEDAQEYGVKIETPLGSYWVIGRRSGKDDELYMCYHASIPQSAAEVAFKIHFGMFS